MSGEDSDGSGEGEGTLKKGDPFSLIADWMRKFPQASSRWGPILRVGIHGSSLAPMISGVGMCAQGWHLLCLPSQGQGPPAMCWNMLGSPLPCSLVAGHQLPEGYPRSPFSEGRLVGTSM